MSHQRKNVAFLRSKEEGDAATEKHHTFISNFRKKKKKSKQDDVDLFCVFLENGAWVPWLQLAKQQHAKPAVKPLELAAVQAAAARFG